MNEHIFVIEDDENIQEILKITLESAGYMVSVFNNAIEAIFALETIKADLMIFDIMLPEMDGITAIKKIREVNTRVPILILSAKDSELDKIKGLDSGGDDYMTKPFSVLELSARVRTLLRRSNPKKNTMIKTKHLCIDKSVHSVMANGIKLELTNKEYQLLLYLIENRDRVIEKKELLNSIWGYDFIGESRALDVQIGLLRKKLNDDGETFIKTIRAVGYRYIEEE